MNLKQLEEAVLALRARGYHSLTPVVMQDCDHSTVPIDRLEIHRGVVTLMPDWIEAVPDDEEEEESA
jgi:hypothetical protein